MTFWVGLRHTLSCVRRFEVATGRTALLGHCGRISRQRAPRSGKLPRRRHHHDRNPIDLDSIAGEVVTCIHADPVFLAQIAAQVRGDD